MGDYVALLDGTPRTLSLPEADLREAIRTSSRDLRVVPLLMTWTQGIRVIRDHRVRKAKARYYLLDLNTEDTEDASLRVFYFGNTQADTQLAFEFYEQRERENRNRPQRQVVLVRVESESALKTAYRGFFADTALFVELVQAASAL